MNDATMLHLIHMLFSGPLLIYVALVQPTSPYVYWLLLLLGIAICFKFTYSAFTTEFSQRHVWFAIHAILFSSLLIYVGSMGPDTPKVGYSLLLAVGIAAIGYHTIRLIQENVSS